MANVQTKILKVIFDFTDDDITQVEVHYSSSEPDNPIWGGGVKKKSFPARIAAIDIMKDEVPDYIMWM